MGDVNINIPTPAAPGEALAQSAIGLVATVTKTADDVYTTENDPAHEKAAIEQHARAAVDNLNAQIQKAAIGSPDEKAAALAKIRAMAQPVLAALFAFLSWTLVACSTFHPLQDAPTWSDPKTAYFDNTTPAQYGSGFNSGILDEIENNAGLVFVITRDRAAKEKALGHAPAPYTDKYGNHVFTLEVSVITDEYKSKQDATVKRLEGVK